VGCICPGNLLNGQHIGQGIQARTPVLLRDLDTHESHLAHLLDRFVRKLAAFIELRGDGGNGSPGEAACGFPNHPVLII